MSFKKIQILAVGTLQTGYPHIQASSQDKEQGVQPRTAICPTTPELTYQPRWAPRLPHVQWLRSPPDREVSDAATCTIAPDPLGGLRCATCPMAPDPTSLRGGLRAPATLAVPCGSWNSKMRKSLSCLPDEDINTSATIIPSVEILGPITRS
jgi:hypothetical protein